MLFNISFLMDSLVGFNACYFFCLNILLSKGCVEYMMIDEITRSSFELYCAIYAYKYIKSRKYHKEFNLLEIESIKAEVQEDIETTVNCLIESSIESIVNRKLKEREAK